MIAASKKPMAFAVGSLVVKNILLLSGIIFRGNQCGNIVFCNAFVIDNAAPIHTKGEVIGVAIRICVRPGVVRNVHMRFDVERIILLDEFLTNGIR